MSVEKLHQYGLAKFSQLLREELYLKTHFDITKPLIIRINTSDRCNYRCPFCNHWARKHYEEELDLETWSEIFSNIAKFTRGAVIQFVGGEPFVRTDFLDIVSACVKSGLKWGIVTNGSGLKGLNISRIIELNPMNVDISIDGATAAIHDQSRQVPGSFKKITTGIKALSIANDKAENLGKGRFSIRLKCVVHKLNAATLPEMVSMVSELGADSIDFTPLRPMANADNSIFEIKEEKTKNDLSASIKTLLKLQQTGSPIETSPSKLRSIMDHVEKKHVCHGHIQCRAGMRDFMIGPSGNVQSCWYYPKIGNVKQETIKNIWHSKKAKKFRKTALTCEKFGKVDCATSCLSHRTILQDIQRGLLHLKRN